MTTDVSLNGVSLATAVPEAIVLRVERDLVGKRRHSDVEIPGRAGSWRFDEEPGTRDLELRIHIGASSFATRRTAVRALADWADPGTTTQLIVDDEPDRYHDAILERSPNLEEWLTEVEDFPLRFVVGPYALAVTPSTETVNVGASPDSDTFTIPDEVIAEPVIEITPSGGALTSFTLTINGNTLTWSGSIGAGETLTISSISDTVTIGENADVYLTGAFEVSDLDMADVDGTFPLLVAGETSWEMTYAGGATSVDLEFTWRERSR